MHLIVTQMMKHIERKAMRKDYNCGEFNSWVIHSENMPAQTFITDANFLIKK